MLFIDCRNDCHDLLRSHPFQQLDGLFLFAGCRFFSPLRRRLFLREYITKRLIGLECVETAHISLGGCKIAMSENVLDGG